MSARRVCACGAELEGAGDALICVGCGARARTWLVSLDEGAVGVGKLLDGRVQPLVNAIPSSWRRGHLTGRFVSR